MLGFLQAERHWFETVNNKLLFLSMWSADIHDPLDHIHTVAMRYRCLGTYYLVDTLTSLGFLF
jgi:hypothetical protein